MRWFNGLKMNSIDSYRQLTQAFSSRFVTNCKAPLLSLSMYDGETLNAYSNRYWETYNEMEDNFDDVAIITFKNSLPADHSLRKFLTGKPATNMRQLMDRIDKYKQVEEDQLQGRGKEKVIPQERKDFRLDRYGSNRPEKGLYRATRNNRCTNCQRHIPRTSALGFGENQERAIL